MRIAKVLAAVIALVAFGTNARAQDDLTVRRHGSPAGTVLRDTISGGLLGAAVGGAVIGYEMGVQNHSDYNWQRTLAVGAGIGLGVGLIVGGIDAASNMDRSYQNPIADQRSVGFGSPLATKALRF